MQHTITRQCIWSMLADNRPNARKHGRNIRPQHKKEQSGLDRELAEKALPAVLPTFVSRGKTAHRILISDSCCIPCTGIFTSRFGADFARYFRVSAILAYSYAPAQQPHKKTGQKPVFVKHQARLTARQENPFCPRQHRYGAECYRQS